MTEQDIKAMQEIHKQELDFLHTLACKYGISMDDMRKLCLYSHVSFAELQNNVLTPIQH